MNIATVGHTDQQILQKLEDFVKYLVLIFEKQLSEFAKRLVDGASKSGKWADIANNDIERKRKDTEWPKILKGVSSILNFCIECDANNCGIENLLDQLLLFKTNPKKIREELIKAGIEIFRCFESQFMQSTCENGSWKIAMIKLADDAVSRICNYFYKNVAKKDFSVESITKGLIHGESKKCKDSGMSHSRRGHTLKNVDTFELWNSEELFTQTGITMANDNGTENVYYQGRNISNTDKYGFRHIFECELKDKVSNNLNPDYKLTKPPRKKYKNLISPIDIVQLQCLLLDTMNSVDSNEIEKKLEELPSGFLETLKQDADKSFQELETFIAINFRELSSFILENQESEVDVQSIRNIARKAIWFDVQEPVLAFVHGQNMLQKIAELIKIGIVVISGMSGMGKSELVRKFAHDHCSDYKGNVIWINAKSPESLKESFHRLAKGSLEIKVKCDDGEEKPIVSLATEVYEYFGSTKSLFILDSVENYASIHPLLPKLPPNFNKPDILITSPNSSDWISDRLQISLVRLNDFTDDEAKQFTKKVLDITNDSQDHVINKFNKKLYNYPLALKQASLYIKERQRYSGYTIVEFLKEFDKSSKKLREDKYLVAVFDALKDTLKRIENEKTLETIMVISYFEPEKIPTTLLVELANGNSMDLISDLDKYGIIKIDKDTFSMHGLIQKMCRIMLKEGKKEHAILSRALEIFKTKVKQYDNMATLGPHILSVWYHAYMYDKLITTFIVNDILEQSAHINYFHFLAYSCNLEVFEIIVNKIENKYPKYLEKIISADDGQNGKPINYAFSNFEIMKFLTEKGAHIKT